MALDFPNANVLADLLGRSLTSDNAVSGSINVKDYWLGTTVPYLTGGGSFPNIKLQKTSLIFLSRKSPNATGNGSHELRRAWYKYEQAIDPNTGLVGPWNRLPGLFWHDTSAYPAGDRLREQTEGWPLLYSDYKGINWTDLNKRWAPTETTPTTTGTAPNISLVSGGSSYTQTGSTAGDLVNGIIEQRAKFVLMTRIAQGIYGENWTYNPNNVSVGQNLNSVLTSRGYTQAEITAWFGYLRTSNAANGTSTIGSGSGGGGGGGGGGNSSSGSKVNPLPSITATPVPVKIRVKAPFGYLQPPTTPKEARPQLLQMYVPDVDLTVQGVALDKNKAKTEVFYFPYVPNDVTYSGLGSQWTEIPRGNSFPIVEWNSWNLMKISMNFLVSAERLDGNTVVPDGVFNSVGEQLNILRRMAQRPYPVSIYGMDQMMSVAIRRAAETGSALEFVISDLQIQSLRRTFDAGDAEITAASVSLTLQEIPIESGKVALLNLPSIVPDETPDEDNDENNQKEYNRLSDFTLGLVAPSSRGTIWTP